MASIHSYTLKDGSTRYMVKWYAPDHSQKLKRGFKRKKQAADYKARIEISINDNDYIDPAAGSVTVGELSKTWLKGKRGTVKPKYLDDLESAYRVHVEPKWGDRSVSSIRHSEVQEWTSELSRGNPEKLAQAVTGMERMEYKPKSASVVIRAFGVLKGIMEMAKADALIKRAATENIQLPHKVRKDRIYLSPKQVLALADAAGRYKSLVLTLGFCGLRWGEAAALRVEDVDAKAGRLRIRRSYVRSGREHYEGEPKTWERREVPVPEQVMAVILKDCKGKAHDALVFCETENRRLREQTVKKNGWYKKALDASGVPYLACHDLRHSAASIAISAGANVKAIQRMLGHKSAAMTLDIYADLFDSDLDSVAENVSEKIRQAS